MLFNIVYDDGESGFFNPYIVGLNLQQLNSFVESYARAKGKFYFRGETFHFDNIVSVHIFDNSKNTFSGRERDYIEYLVTNTAKVRNLNMDVESDLRQLGVEVTDDFIKGSYGYELEKINELKLIEQEWRNIPPVIERVAKKKYADGHFADSVESAFKEINDIVKKEYTKIKGNELDGVDLMRQAFSVKNPTFKLADLSDETGRNIQQGYMDIFAGAMMGIRNPKAHKNLDVHPDEAWEMIVLASHLMRMWDKRII